MSDPQSGWARDSAANAGASGASQRPTALLTNDDGYWAPGIQAMHDALVAHYDVFVVAPDSHRSGCGHGITLTTPLHYEQLAADFSLPGYRCNGTPADCVKLARFRLLQVRPTLVVSGTNLGENTGVAAFYSGTIAGAREGALWQIPSFAVSIEAGAEEFLADYSRRAVAVIQRLMELPEHAEGENPRRVVYDINFPGCAPTQLAGVRLARQSLAPFEDIYEWREDHEDRGPGLWLSGGKIGVEADPDVDSRALHNRYATVTPLGLDTTDHASLEMLNDTFGGDTFGDNQPAAQ